MTLIARLIAAFERLTEVVNQRGLPPGGATGQVLAKGSNADRIVTWTTPAAGGGGGASGTPTFIQETRPLSVGPWVWWVTDATGKPINMIINDGGA